MTTVTVSPKFQIVIPKAVREALHLLPGQKLQIVQAGGRLELIPLLDIRKARGFLKGMDTTFGREDGRL